MWTQCLLLLLAVCVFCIWFSSRRFKLKGPKIPGPTPLPLLGNFLEFVFNKLDVIDTLLKMSHRYGGFMQFWLGNNLCVVITEPEHLQIFYSSASLIDRADEYGGIADVLGEDSLFVASGEIWKKMRKMFMQTFNPTPLEELINNFINTKESLINDLRVKADGKTFPSIMILKKAMAHAILRNALNETKADEEINFILHRINYLSRQCYVRQFSPWMRYNIIFNRTAEGRKYWKYISDCNKWTQEIIIKKQRELQRLKLAGESIPNFYMYNMLEKYGDESVKVFLNEFKNLFITGMDTTSSTMGFFLIVMGLFPDIQSEVYLEDQKVQKLLAGKDIVAEDMQHYKYLERVIKETLRLFPIGPLIARKLREDTQFGKYLVPKGASIGALSIYTYHNPNIFPDPLKFDPDRFLPENVAKRHPFAYSPFSGGPRGCPGIRYAMVALKIMLSAIVREFKIISHYQSIEEVLKNTEAIVTLSDRQSFPIRLQLRRTA